MSRQLTQTAIKQLNELMARGIAFEDALSQVAVWENVSEQIEQPAQKIVQMRPSTTRAQVIETYHDLFQHLHDTGIVPHVPELGCTPQELLALEQDTQRDLPFAYTDWLARVGKARTRLISHNHIAAEYHRLRQMQSSGLRFMAKNTFKVPPTAFFILSHLGDCYHYIECDTPNAIDAQVWSAHEDLDAPFIAYASVLDLVKDLAQQAQCAWNSGYFQHRPEGTQA